MPTQIKQPPPPLWAYVEYHVRDKVGWFFMHLTRHHAKAATRGINRAIRIAPWLNKAGTTSAGSLRHRRDLPH
jgi:hypothetical protein